MIMNRPIIFDNMFSESLMALYEAMKNTIQYSATPIIPEYSSVLSTPTSEAYLFAPNNAFLNASV